MAARSGAGSNALQLRTRKWINDATPSRSNSMPATYRSFPPPRKSPTSSSVQPRRSPLAWKTASALVFAISDIRIGGCPRSRHRGPRRSSGNQRSPGARYAATSSLRSTVYMTIAESTVRREPASEICLGWRRAPAGRPRRGQPDRGQLRGDDSGASACAVPEVPPRCWRLDYQDSSGSIGIVAEPVCRRVPHASSYSSGDSQSSPSWTRRRLYQPSM